MSNLFITDGIGIFQKHMDRSQKAIPLVPGGLSNWGVHFSVVGQCDPSEIHMVDERPSTHECGHLFGRSINIFYANNLDYIRTHFMGGFVR